jgi:hypothetical protein
MASGFGSCHPGVAVSYLISILERTTEGFSVGSRKNPPKF